MVLSHVMLLDNIFVVIHEVCLHLSSNIYKIVSISVKTAIYTLHSWSLQIYSKLGTNYYHITLYFTHGNI